MLPPHGRLFGFLAESAEKWQLALNQSLRRTPLMLNHCARFPLGVLLRTVEAAGCRSEGMGWQTYVPIGNLSTRWKKKRDHRHSRDFARMGRSAYRVAAAKINTCWDRPPQPDRRSI